jgi:hypothetical protein
VRERKRERESLPNERKRERESLPNKHVNLHQMNAFITEILGRCLSFARYREVND